MSSNITDDITIPLRPIKNGTIFVFNSIQQGMFTTVTEQINHLVKNLEEHHIHVKPVYFVAFGPFDNVIRFDVDDFCIVNNLSSLPGVSSQQIQCAYTIWESQTTNNETKYNKSFCCITQLKIQNHLMLGWGPEIEEAIAELLALTLKQNTPNDIDIELMATLGWDEFFIFTRNTRGYSSLFKPILEKVRRLTLLDLKPFLEKRGYKYQDREQINLDKKHLFLSSYTTPAYDQELSNYMEKYFRQKLQEKGSRNIISLTEKEIDTLFTDVESLPENFGIDQVSISTRLSIKPGHLNEVKNIIAAVLARLNPLQIRCDDIFSLGRYDVYPWLGEIMSCKRFLILFESLRFSLSGNLERLKGYKDYLTQTQYYNSFTIFSYLDKDKTGIEMNDAPKLDIPAKENMKTEGAFISKLDNLCLGHGKKEPITNVFTKEGGILKQRAPCSIVVGVARIFSLFDSCILDRFTCDSFIDMYPFMHRVREIVDTVKEKKENPKILEFTIENGKGNSMTIDLQESNNPKYVDPLVGVIYKAIQHFYQGFVHRYMSSYPMMDKNETGVDFSGRLHRILSAITGMQNIMLDDLGCHLKKGFNVISPYPNIRIHRESFNISEANVFHMFQPEIFYSMFHEIIHTFYHTKELQPFKKKLNEMSEIVPDKLALETMAKVKDLFQEMVGDVFLLNNGFANNYKLYAFWYWLLLLQSQKKVDSHIIMRFLFTAAVEDKESRDIMFRYSKHPVNFILDDAEKLLNIIVELIDGLDYPAVIQTDIISRVESYYNTLDSHRQSRLTSMFSILFPSVESLYPLIKHSLKKFSYLQDIDNNYRELYEKMPLRPEDNKNQRQISSVRMFRGILKFIHDNREHLVCGNDCILNFSTNQNDLRKKLFRFRMALINTLQWESLHWKKKLIGDHEIKFPVQLVRNSCEDSNQ